MVGQDELLKRAWEGGYQVGSNVVAVLVRGLRKKLGSADWIESVHGVGFRLVNPQ